MIGRRTMGQGQLFYEFALDEVVLSDHLVRKIDVGLVSAGGTQEGRDALCPHEMYS